MLKLCFRSLLNSIIAHFLRSAEESNGWWHEMGIRSSGIRGAVWDRGDEHLRWILKRHPHPEEESSRWDINPVSPRLPLAAGQLYLYYSKMQIVFLLDVGAERRMIGDDCRISCFQDMRCLCGSRAANWGGSSRS